VLIAPQVEVLGLEMALFGASSWVHPTLLWDEKEAVLIDAGYYGQFEQLREQIEQAGVSLDRLTRLIVTHQDIDHIGGIGALLVSNDRIEVLALEQERAYVIGEKRIVKLPPERIEQLSEHLSYLPEEQREAMIDDVTNPRPRVDRTLADGERLPYCGGIVVIHTPGHTPGHISLYLESSRVLVAGDALNVSDGRLIGPIPQLTPDVDQATSSLRKLASYEIETVVCYHGGPYTAGDVNERIAELADEPVSGG